MESTTVNFYLLKYRNVKTYLIAFLFVIGNIVLPQLCHLVNLGGNMLLPIYFFTLVAAYKYGWKAGLLTAVLSPIVNTVLFGMPIPAALPIILIKSVLLSVSAGFAAQYFKRITIPILTGVVIFYQLIGSLIEWAIVADFHKALNDLTIGIPGILLQILGSYFIIRHLIKK